MSVLPQESGSTSKSIIDASSEAIRKYQHWDVFLSYSRPDEELALRAVAALEARRLKVWFDLWQFPDHGWRRAIEDGLKGSQAFILVTTQAQPSPWVKSELLWAQHRGATQPGSFPILRLSTATTARKKGWLNFRHLPTIEVLEDSRQAWDYAIAEATATIQQTRIATSRACFFDEDGCFSAGIDANPSKNIHLNTIHADWRKRSSDELQELFRTRPCLWNDYHDHYDAHATHWQAKPIKHVVDAIGPAEDLVIGDFGCGRAELASQLGDQNKVHSFDYVPATNDVHACDMAKTPLKDRSLDQAVYSLSLMCDDIRPHLAEASRTLKPGGQLHIVEPSRWFFDRAHSLRQQLQRFGLRQDTVNYDWKFGHLVASRLTA